MAKTVDERIVAAKFDASDFEKGVNKTIKKLDELKKNLDFKEAIKGVKELAEKTEVSTNSMSNSLEKLTNRFTTFTGMIKQKILSGLADEVAGVFLRMEQSVKSFIRAVGSDQVSAGMNKYQSMLTSVRQMVNAGHGEAAVYEQLDRLQTYSDETSYSFDQMADAMSKMVSAGVGLEDAAKTVEGIANACADAGINANEAQRAYYNLSQAYTKGVLNYTDYRSLEALNMTTREFREQMLEAAVAAETLEKSVKKVNGKEETVYKTTNKKDKKVRKGKVVNIDNLVDTLKYDFMNKKAMNNLFGSTYWMEVIDKGELEKLRKELGDAEFEKRFGKIATKAYQAAYEARSFLDVLNAIKDAVSSSWSKTFEHLFGKLDEAREFFTELSNSGIAKFIYMINDFRNAVLDVWNDAKNVGAGGGKVLRDTILNLSDAFGTLLRTIFSIIPGFDEFYKTEGETNDDIKSLGTELFIISMKLRDFSDRVKEATDNFHKFMTEKSIDDGNGGKISRVEKLRKILSNIASVLGTVWKIGKIAFNFVYGALIKFQPIWDSLLDFFDKITAPLKELKNNEEVFGNIQDSAGNISKILDKIVPHLTTIVSFLGDVGAFVANFAIDTITSNLSFIADIIDLITYIINGGDSKKAEKGEDFLSRLKKDFEDLKKVCEDCLNVVKGFFDSLIKDLKTLFAITDENNEGENKGPFMNLINFFDTSEFVKSVKTRVNTLIDDITKFILSIPSRLKDLAINVYDIVWGLIFKKETVNKVLKNGAVIKSEKVELTEFGKRVYKFIDDVKAFILDIPNKVVNAIGTIGSWIDLVFDSLLGNTTNTNKEGSDKNKTDQKKEEEKQKEEKKERFQAFIDEAIASVKKWFDDLPNNIRRRIRGIGTLFTKIWNTLDEFLFGKKVTKTVGTQDLDTGKLKKTTITTRIKKGFSKWLENVIIEIKKFIINIPTYIKEGIKGAGDIITSIIGAVFGKPNGEEVSKKDIEDKIAEPFLGIDLSAAGNAIKEIGKELLNQIIRIFTGSEDVDSNMNRFSEKIAEGIKWIREKAEIALKYVTDFLINLPTRIANFFSGESSSNQEKGPIGREIARFGEAIKAFIINLPTTLAIGFTNAIEEIDKWWDKLYNHIKGEKTEEVVNEGEQKSSWDDFVESLGTLISTAFEKLPKWAEEGFDIALDGLDKLIKRIGNWFDDQTVEANLDLLPDNQKESVSKYVEKMKKDTESPLVRSIRNLGNRIYTLLTETIPDCVNKAWTWLGTQGALIFKGINEVFSGNIPEEEDTSVAETIGLKIGDYLKNVLPGKIQVAWENLKTISTDLYKGIHNVFSGDVPEEGEDVSVATTIGQKIGDFLKNVLPGKIKIAWESMKSLAKDIYDGIAAAFTGDIPESDRAKVITNIIDTIKSFITKDLPKAISGIFDKDTSLEKNLNLLPDDQKKYFTAYADKMKKDSENLTKKGSGIFSFVDTFKTGIINAFEDIGPTILNGLATALDWIGDVAKVITDILTGKSSVSEIIEGAYSEEKPELKNALINVGNSLKTFFLETIPTLIGTAIGEVAKLAPTWFETLFGAIGDAADKESNKIDGGGAARGFDGKIENATGALDAAKNIFDKLSSFVGENEDFLKIMGVIITLVMLFKAMRDLFTFADEVEGASDVVKWVAIIAAISAVSTILDNISKIVDENEPSKVENMKQIIDKIGNVLLTIGGIMLLFTGGKIADAVDDIAGKKDGVKKTVADLSTGEKMVNSIATGVTNLLSILGFSGGAAIGSDMLKIAVDNIFTTIVDSFMTISGGISDALGIVKPFVEDLAELEDDIEKAISACVNLSALISTFYDVFEWTYENALDKDFEEQLLNATDDIELQRILQEHNEQKNMDPESKNEFLAALQSRIAIFEQISLTLNSLFDTLTKFDVNSLSEIESKINIILAELGDHGKLTELIIELFNALNYAIDNSKMNPHNSGVTKKLKEIDSSMLSIALSIIGDALSIFTNGISGLNLGNVDAFKETLTVFTELSKALDGNEFTPSTFDKLVNGKTTLSDIGFQIKTFGLHMKTFYGYITKIPGFDNDDLKKKTLGQIDSVVDIANRMAGAAHAATGASVETFGKLGEKLPAMGSNLASFITNLNSAFNTNGNDISLDKITTLSDMITSISTLFASTAPYATGITLSDLTSVMLGDLNGKDGEDFANNIQAIITKIAEVFKPNDENSEKIKEAGRDVGKLFLTAIEETFTDPEESFDPIITPILDMTTAEEQLRNFFGSGVIEGVDLGSVVRAAYGANNQTDEDRVTASLLHSELETIAAAIKTGPDSLANIATVGDVANAFASMRIVTDTGAIVGLITPAIDEQIGNAIWMIERNVTPVYHP